MRASILIAATGFLLLGCNSNKSPSNNDTPNELQRVMAEDGNPSYQQLTAKLLAKQPPVEGLDYAKTIAELTPEAALDAWATKVEIDSRLTARNGGQPLFYNRDFPSLAGPLQEGRMQCFSGSMLNLIVQRQKPQAEFSAAKPVMIFTPGHILPGYVVDDHLVGVETTVIGRGRNDFGPTKELQGPIRVVDAEAFVQMYVYQAKLKDVPAMVQILLKQTASRYGIPLDRTEAGIAKGELTIAADAPLNRVAFGFGLDADISESGDKQRMFADDIVPKQGYSNRAVISGEGLGTTGAMSVGVIAPPRAVEDENSVRSMFRAFKTPLEYVLFPQTPPLVAQCASDRELIVAKAQYLNQVKVMLRELPSESERHSSISVREQLSNAGAAIGLGDAKCFSTGPGSDLTNECAVWRPGPRPESGGPRLITFFSVQFKDGKRIGFRASHATTIDGALTDDFDLERNAEDTTMFVRLRKDKSALWKKGRIVFPVHGDGILIHETHVVPSVCAPVQSREVIPQTVEALMPIQPPPTAETPASKDGRPL